ncbi:DUF2336 domain-containing protein [Sphingomonas morindae]|uniref:DUF2336 domain-containing protein n=1 Tax=Sphingomonas morindae TaxID=1541170 RepID=A0ABY4X4D5_9SPHN|nr:DUF2336 domain-containing protein [Sphingomonas morindae]USI71766.1 DUF2336 domain-containing protein [Sphingomonas morindae]
MSGRRFPDEESDSGGALLGAAAAADRLADARRAAAAHELARPLALAIDDETRARAGLIVEHLIQSIEALLRGAEPLLDAAPGFDCAARFVGAGLLQRSGLAAAALARAEEHRLAAALVRGYGLAVEEEAPGARRLDPIGGTLAAESFAVRAAEATRLDRSGDPLLPLHDLSAEDRHALFWQVAACLADAALATLGAAGPGSEETLHRAAEGAVARTLAAIDEADGIGAAAMRLAHGLRAADQLDDALLAGTLAAGRIATLAALLAVRAGIGFDEAHAMLAMPARAALLLRGCDVARPVAAAMILALAIALDRGVGPDPAERAALLLQGFDRLGPDQARAAVRRARLEPLYRAGLAALGRAL